MVNVEVPRDRPKLHVRVQRLNLRPGHLEVGADFGARVTRLHQISLASPGQTNGLAGLKEAGLIFGFIRQDQRSRRDALLHRNGLVRISALHRVGRALGG